MLEEDEEDIIFRKLTLKDSVCSSWRPRSRIQQIAARSANSRPSSSSSMYAVFRAKDAHSAALITRMRKQCIDKGIGGIKGLAVLFRGMDKDYSKSVTFEEFEQGIRRYGLELTGDELRFVFLHLDRDRSGSIDFSELLVQLSPPMSQNRVDVVLEAFDKLDAINDGVLRIDDLKIVYKSHAERHPRYVSGEWTLEQVLQHFLDSFDSKHGEEKDGVVTREEFLHYYSAVSCTIEDDSYFDLMMRNTWALPAKRTVTRRGESMQSLHGKH